MATRPELIRRILLALDAMDGNPAPRDILIDAVTIRFSPRPPRADVEDAILEAEQACYIAGADVALEGIHYLLTKKGHHKARFWK